MNLRSIMPFAGRAPARADDPFSQLHREINRAFGDVWRDFGAVPAAGGAIGWTPSVDVKEENGRLLVTAELPGVSEKDVSVTVDGDLLTIAGEKKAEREEKDEKGAWHITERSWGAFRRSFSLPFEPPPGAIEASFANGVLKVSLPKPPEPAPKTKQIPIRNG
jgi:HSP20 family protein